VQHRAIFGDIDFLASEQTLETAGDVARGSRAAQSGLASGDVILAASTTEFTDLASWRASFNPRPQQLVLSILRGNQRGQLQMR